MERKGESEMGSSKSALYTSAYRLWAAPQARAGYLPSDWTDFMEGKAVKKFRSSYGGVLNFRTTGFFLGSFTIDAACSARMLLDPVADWVSPRIEWKETGFLEKESTVADTFCSATKSLVTAGRKRRRSWSSSSEERRRTARRRNSSAWHRSRPRNAHDKRGPGRLRSSTDSEPRNSNYQERNTYPASTGGAGESTPSASDSHPRGSEADLPATADVEDIEDLGWRSLEDSLEEGPINPPAFWDAAPPIERIRQDWNELFATACRDQFSTVNMTLFSRNELEDFETQTSQDIENPWVNLPVEIVLRTFHFLSAPGLSTASLTCRRFLVIGENGALWERLNTLDHNCSPKHFPRICLPKVAQGVLLKPGSVNVSDNSKRERDGTENASENDGYSTPLSHESQQRDENLSPHFLSANIKRAGTSGSMFETRTVKGKGLYMALARVKHFSRMQAEQHRILAEGRRKRLAQVKAHRFLRCWSKTVLDSFIGFMACLFAIGIFFLFPGMLALKLDGFVDWSWLVIFGPFHATLPLPLLFFAVKLLATLYVASRLGRSSRIHPAGASAHISTSKIFHTFIFNWEFANELLFMGGGCLVIDSCPCMLSWYLDGWIQRFSFALIPVWTYLTLAVFLIIYLGPSSQKSGRLKLLSPLLLLLLFTILLTRRMDGGDQIPLSIVSLPLLPFLVFLFLAVLNSGVYAICGERSVKRKFVSVVFIASSLALPLLIFGALYLKALGLLETSFLTIFGVYTIWLVLGPLSIGMLDKSVRAEVADEWDD